MKYNDIHSYEESDYMLTLKEQHPSMYIYVNFDQLYNSRIPESFLSEVNCVLPKGYFQVVSERIADSLAFCKIGDGVHHWNDLPYFQIIFNDDWMQRFENLRKLVIEYDCSCIDRRTEQ